mmetsp:Transcript_35788/g.93712  ORF Transcript_35788/g.93712 Transcript_35788/m.93712 type:complete len:561 (+) Transcript_35788:29-1711(+)
MGAAQPCTAPVHCHAVCGGPCQNCDVHLEQKVGKPAYRSPFAELEEDLFAAPLTARLAPNTIRKVKDPILDKQHSAQVPQFVRRSLCRAIDCTLTGIPFSDRYRIVGELGHGTSAQVLKAVDVADGTVVAVKRFSRQKGRVNPSSVLDAFQRERALLMALDHPNIVRLFEACVDNRYLYLILEYCEGRELYEFIVNPPVPKAEAVGGLVFRQMVDAVSALQSMNIVHRDLKSENFLFLRPPAGLEQMVHPSPQDVPLLKLCDFGAAERLSPSHPRSVTKAGTLSYTAPEVYSLCSAGAPSDIWSLGVTLYTLLTGRNPFRRGVGGETADMVIARIKNGEYNTSTAVWNHLSFCARDIIKGMLNVQEEKRLTMSQILSHDFLRRMEVGSEALAQRQALEGLLQERLLRWKRRDALQRLACTARAHCAFRGTSPACVDEVQEMCRAFLLFDTQTKDGVLTAADLGNAFRVEALVEADTDGSGSIDLTEWLAVMLTTSDEEVHAAAFNCLDAGTTDGILDASDVCALLGTEFRAHAATMEKSLERWTPQGPLTVDRFDILFAT